MKTPFVRSTVFLASAFLAFGSAMTEVAASPLVTDRPDQTESSSVVSRGRVQIEAGFDFNHFDLAGETLEETSFPSTLVRYGLDRKVELRFGWLGYVNEELEVGGPLTGVVEVGEHPAHDRRGRETRQQSDGLGQLRTGPRNECHEDRSDHWSENRYW